MDILELFAGVGGFRLGLEKSSKKFFKTKWANQWEPSKKAQDAFEIYNFHYHGKSENLNLNIEEISNDDFKNMKADIIVGGFPCQDYSVAKSKVYEKGIEGKKGILFWQIIRATKIIKPTYLILENVDRLLKSPSIQKGRDFSIMLKSFDKLGYSVEWRIINAADYGEAQKRKRVFLFIYKNESKFGIEMDLKYSKNQFFDNNNLNQYIFFDGLFARQFKVENNITKNRRLFNTLPKNIIDISDSFSSKFWNSGIMRYGKFITIDTIPDNIEVSKKRNLKSILQLEKEIDFKYIITNKDIIKKFEYLRSSKKEERETKEGHKWIYSEGAMSLYDDVNLPARTMLTSEGTVNRSSHFLKIKNKYRFLTPIEAERLNNFPDNWTKYKFQKGEKIEVSDRMRYFCMGNALVVHIIKRIGDEIQKIEK